MVYNPLLVIDWKVVSLDDPVYKGVADGNVIITKTGSISLTVKAPAAGILTALQVAADAKTVTIATSISVVAARETVSALKFADGNTDFSGTVNFGANRVAITARSEGMSGDLIRVNGIEGGDLTFADPAELSPLTGSMTVAAATATGAAEVYGIDGALITIRTGLAVNFSITATGGKSENGNLAKAVAIKGSELRIKSLLAGAVFTVNATGGKNGDGDSACAYGMVSDLADIEITQQLTGNFNLTARGGTASGDAGANAAALTSARDITIGETLNSLRITVSATGGQGMIGRADSAAFRAAEAIDIDGGLYTFWNISATGGKGVSDAGAAATAIEAGALAAGGLLSGAMNVTARGGSGAINAEAEATGFDVAGGNVELTSADAAFRITLQAYGGSATGSANAVAAGITAGNIVFAENAAGNYTLTANAGAGTASARAAVYGWNVDAADVDGSLGGSWVLNAGGGRGNADVGATITAIAASGAIEFGNLAANFTVNARGGSGANADADGRGLSGGTIRIINGLTGNWTLNVTGGQNTATLGTSATAYAAALAATGDLTVGGAFAGNFNLTSRGGNWGDGHAEVHAIDAAGAVALGNFTAGARFTLSATGGTNGADLSAAAVAIRGDTVSTGNWIGSHSVTVSAGNGSADASAYGAMLEATGGNADLGILAGIFTLNVRGGANGVSNRAEADALKVAGDLKIVAFDKSFAATLNATSGGNGIDSVARSIILTGSAITVSGEFAGTFTVNATGGKTRTGAVAGNSSAVGAIGVAGNKFTVGAFGQTTATVNVKGGSDAIDNNATANGFYGGTGLETGAVGSNFRLTVTAAGGNGSKVTAASSQSVSADAVGRAFATGSGELKLTCGFAGTLTVTATAGAVNGGNDTSATATAHAFYAGVDTTGQLTIIGAITGNLTVKAAANNFSQVGDAALAVGFGASGAISLDAFNSAFRLTVDATSIGNADSRALRSGNTLAVERLDGSWTVSAKSGGTYSSGCAAAHAFTASKAITVAALATTLKVTLSATGGNATLTGNAFTDSRVFYSIGGAVDLNGVAGTFVVTAVSNKAIEDSYSRGYFISSLGVTTGDFDRGFKLQISTRGGTSYQGDANAESYGIFGGIGSIAVGTLAGTFELAATGGVGSAAAISSTPQKVAAGSAAANAIALAGKGITLGSIDSALKMKLTAKAGVSAVGNRTKTASAESRAIQSKDGNLTVTGKIGGAIELAATGGVVAAGSANPTKVEPGYNEYAAANATASLASGNAVSLGNCDPGLKFIALATAGSASSEARAQTGHDAQAESYAAATTAAVLAESGDLAIARLAGSFTMASRGGSATAIAASQAKTPDMNAVAVAAANAVGVGFSGDSVTLNQVDPGLRIVISATAGKAAATASKINADGSGTVSATASAYATASGIRSVSGVFSVTGNQFNGLIAVTAIGGSATTNGQAVTGDAVAGKSYGIYSAGAIHGADAAHALVIAKVIAAAANTEAYAICGNGLNLTVNGALYAGYHTNAATVADALAKLVGTGKSAANYLADALKLNGKAYAVKGGDADDMVSFGSGSIAIGNIDLGGGSNTLSLTHQSQLCGDILAGSGGTLNLIINLGGDSSANPIITVGSDAGKTLGGASVSILIGAAQLGSYILVKNGGDFAANSFTVNGRSLAVGHEIRLDNGTYVSLHIDSKKQLIFTAGAGHNPNATSDTQLFGTPSADPEARQLLGGAGDDLHLVRNSGDTIAENAAGGDDTVVAGVSYTLGDNLENLFLHGRGDLDATGNADANRIAGNAGNNILDGGGGDDSFIFSENWGHDLVRNDGGAIELLFTGGLRADDLTFETDGDDLMVTAKLTGDTIRVENWALNSANSIRFGDDLYFDNYLLRSQLGCFATLETLSEQTSTKNASLAS